MATAWVRSLSCRSSHAVTDVAVAPSPEKKPPLPVSCAAAAAADVTNAAVLVQQARKKELGRERERRREARQRHEPRPRLKKKPKPMATKALFVASPAPLPVPAPASASAAFLTMAELPEGHSSRRVVELIFSSGWGDAPAGVPAVEALFRVHCVAARFEEARAAARRRAREAAARCGADGNEMMRFQCRAPADAVAGGVFGAGVATCRLGSSVSAVRTFDCSGAAHAGAGGVGGAASGRRAMLVCRVIAGRVRLADDLAARHAIDYDSVDMGNGELVVLDSRAVLPCFLIIYKV